MSDQNPRLTAEARREQILDVAAMVFGERGYAGGTTDDIARGAGISQAYVVRMFGSKEKLYVEVVHRARNRIMGAFRAVIAEAAPGEDLTQCHLRLGEAYVEMVSDRGVLLTLHNLFAMGHDETLGPLARESLLEVYSMLRDEAGMTPEQAVSFFAQGMLINVVLGVQLPQSMAESAVTTEFVTATFGSKFQDLERLLRPGQP